MTDHTLRFSLEDNAMHSLQHGIEHLNGVLMKERRVEVDLKFAVLHIFHACELLCKRKIQIVAPGVLHKKKTGRTISATDARNWLKNKGTITKDQSRMLERVEAYRDDVTHFQVDLDAAQVRSHLGSVLVFLLEFCERELNLKLEDVLEHHIWMEIRELIRTHEQLLERARQLFEAEHPRHWVGGGYEEAELFFCDQCGTMSQDANGTCFFCEDTYDLGECLRCTERLTPLNEGGLCDYCGHMMDRARDE